MKINFIFLKKFFIFFSVIFIIISIYSFFIFGIKYSTEFTGGVEIHFKSQNLDINKINNKIKIYKIGQNDEFIIKCNNKKKIYNYINYIKQKNIIKIIKIETFKPEINSNIIKKSYISLFVAFFLMFFYLTYRFKYLMALNGMLALLHDIFLILGIISLLKIEIDISIVASIFTIFGYSINDTVIIYDRIKENKKIYKNINFIIEKSINDIFKRTLLTSFSTIIVILIIMYFFETLFYFSLISMIGIIIGTYSSIYISTILLYYKK